MSSRRLKLHVLKYVDAYYDLQSSLQTVRWPPLLFPDKKQSTLYMF